MAEEIPCNSQSEPIILPSKENKENTIGKIYFLFVFVIILAIGIGFFIFRYQKSDISFLPEPENEILSKKVRVDTTRETMAFLKAHKRSDGYNNFLSHFEELCLNQTRSFCP